MTVDLYKAFARLLSDRPVVYHPALTHLAGGVKTGLLLNVVCHWGLGKTAQENEGWIYIPVKQMQAITGMTVDEQQAARDKLVSLGLIEAERRGVHGFWHYRVCMDQIAEAMGSDDWDFSWETFQDEADGPSEDEPPEPPASIPAQGVSREKTDGSIGKTPSSTIGKIPTHINNRIFNAKKQSLILRAKFARAGRQKVGSKKTTPAVPAELEGLIQPGAMGAFNALKTHEEKRTKSKTYNLAGLGFPEPALPLANVFAELIGRPPISDEITYWKKAIYQQMEMGLSPQDLRDAHARMVRDDLPVKSPGSLTALAWDAHQKRSGKYAPSGSQAAYSNGIDLEAFFANL